MPTSPVPQHAGPVITSGRGGPMVRLKDSCAVSPAASVAWTVNVEVPCWVGVPSTTVEAAANSLGMVMPGGTLPETTLNVMGVGPVPEAWITCS